MAQETENRALERDRLSRGVSAVVADSSKGIYYVAVVAGEVMGQLLITYEWSDWRNGNFWWIQSVYVARDARGRGVFKALFEHVLQFAKSQESCCGLRLYMDRDNAAARQVYERVGMRPTSYEVFELDRVLETRG